MVLLFVNYPVSQAISEAWIRFSIFLRKHDIPGIAGIDTRALTKILREKGTMNGMITVNENYDLDEIIPQLKSIYNRKSS